MFLKNVSGFHWEWWIGLEEALSVERRDSWGQMSQGGCHSLHLLGAQTFFLVIINYK